MIWIVLMDLVLILVATRIIGDVFVMMKNARVVGQIVAGVLIGPTVLSQEVAAWVFPSDARYALNSIASVGLILYMLDVGLAFNPSSLEGNMKQVLALGVSAVFISGALTGALTFFPPVNGEAFQGTQGSAAFFVSVFSAACVSALPVSALVLEEKGMATSPAGVICIAASALVTVFMFVMLGLAGALASSNDDPGWLFPFKMGLLVLMLLLPVASKCLLRDKFKSLTPDALGPGAKYYFFVLALLGAVATDRLGVTTLLGPFIVGVATSPLPQATRRALHPASAFTTNYLLPIFFGLNGLAADLRVVKADMIGGMALVVVVAMLGKALTALVGKALGMSWTEALVQAVLLNCRGLLVLVVNMRAMELGLYGDATAAAFLLLGLISTAVTVPLLNSVMGAGADEHGEHKPVAQEDTDIEVTQLVVDGRRLSCQ